MVSDYEKATIAVRQSAGLLKKPEDTIKSQGVPFQSLCDAGIITASIQGDPSGPPPSGGFRYRMHLTSTGEMINGTFRMTDFAFHYARLSGTSPTWVFDPLVEPKSILRLCRQHKPVVTSLVTETLAQANRASVDVLTAFAEMPKSVSSVISGIKSVVTILRDAKKGQFNLDKAHKLREKRLTDRYKNRVRRLQEEISSKKTSPSRKKVLSDHLDRTRLKYRDTLKRSADELASESANLWLNYRYNIMPNVFLAQDVFDAVLKFKTEFVTTRKTERDAVQFELVTSSSDPKTIRFGVDRTLRCMIKRNFTPEHAAIGGSVISNDIFVTAWELIPLSFVYDWFLNIGDLLSAQMYNYKWAQEGATKSVTLEFDSELAFVDSDREFTIDTVTEVSGKYHRREVINPSDECGLVWQPTVGLGRQADALALLWRPVRSLLLKGKTQ